MNDRLWWHVARSTGLVAWLALAAAMVTGGLLANRLVSEPTAIRRVVGLHRHAAAVGLGLVVVHLGALVADDYVEFSLLDVLVPMHSTWRPAAAAWGIAAFYLLFIVEVSSLAHRRLSKRAWRMVHQASVLGFASATVHLLDAGTDASRAVVRFPVVVVAGAVTFLYLGRIVRLGQRSSMSPPRHLTLVRPLATVDEEAYAGRHDNDVTSRSRLVQGQ